MPLQESDKLLNQTSLPLNQSEQPGKPKYNLRTGLWRVGILSFVTCFVLASLYGATVLGSQSINLMLSADTAPVCYDINQNRFSIPSNFSLGEFDMGVEQLCFLNGQVDYNLTRLIPSINIKDFNSDNWEPTTAKEETAFVGEGRDGFEIGKNFAFISLKDQDINGCQLKNGEPVSIDFRVVYEQKQNENLRKQAFLDWNFNRAEGGTCSFSETI
jgi:hypothetical protein